jgi:hypothetical protein
VPVKPPQVDVAGGAAGGAARQQEPIAGRNGRLDRRREQHGHVRGLPGIPCLTVCLICNVEYVRREGNGRVVSTNTVEGFFSILKRGIYGIYQLVSEAHLHRYLNEFDFRYSNREKLGVNDVARASSALKGAKGRRLTYETTN